MRGVKLIGCTLLLIVLAAGAAIVLTARMYMTPEKVMRSVQDALELQAGVPVMTCGGA